MNNIPDSCPIPPDMMELGRLRMALDKLPKLDGKGGTNGRVYGGDENLVHIQDGQRANMGAKLAIALDSMMRADAIADGLKTPEDAEVESLCPGCYMVTAYDMLVHLAVQNGQSIREMARSMANVFAQLAADPFRPLQEEIDVITDEDEANNPAIAGFILPHMESL